MNYYLLRDDADQYHVLHKDALSMDLLPYVVASGFKDGMKVLKKALEDEQCQCQN